MTSIQEAIEVRVAAEGDVTLLCGNGTGRIVRKIRVSSQVLSRMSPVFKAMLAPRFREGSVLSTTGEVEIALPDDDPETMELLCNIVHMTGDIPTQLASTRILTLALLCDKYNGPAALKALIHGWMYISHTNKKTSVQAELLEAACALRFTGLARRFMQELVMRDSLRTSAVDQATTIPQHIIAELEELKAKGCKDWSAAVSKELQAIIELKQRHKGHSNICTAADQASGKVVNCLMHKRLWLVAHITSANLDELFADIKKLDLGGLVEYCSSVCPIRRSDTMSYELDAVMGRLKTKAIKIYAEVELSAFQISIC